MRRFLAIVLVALLAMCGVASAKAPSIHQASKPGLRGSAAAPTVGEVLTTTNGTWTGSGLSFTYQWQDCNSVGASCVNIGGATASSYTIVSADLGDTITAIVTATNSGGSVSQTAAVTGVVTSSSGFTGTCTTTISAGANVGTAESAMSPGQVLCLNSGVYGNTTTNHYVYSGSGTSGNPITVTSGPGQTATLQGFEEISGAWITLENLNIDESNNQIASPSTGANPVPPCAASQNKAEAIEFEGGAHDTLIDNNIYQSVVATREIDIFITANNVTIQNNDISHAGTCDQTQHLIYLDGGSGTVITQNWFWSDQFGYAIQIYPNPGTATISSNVMDGVLDGIIDDSSVGGNAITHNVVINPVTNSAIIAGQNSQSFGGGFFQASFHDQTGAVDTQTNNAVFNASGGFGVTSSTSFITISGQTTLAADPFVNSSGHFYNLCTVGNGACTSGQITAGTALASYGLWNGNGPPSPDPARSLASVVAPTAQASSDVPWEAPAGAGAASLVFALLLVGVARRNRV